ncbi:hypothetical protein BX666DRAFT_576316 [Dichotomocladium elegans]|nr:hypothetical protein BX666DRAFT_576316 [Dichotomocladium elegans]
MPLYSVSPILFIPSFFILIVHTHLYFFLRSSFFIVLNISIPPSILRPPFSLNHMNVRLFLSLSIYIYLYLCPKLLFASQEVVPSSARQNGVRRRGGSNKVKICLFPL